MNRGKHRHRGMWPTYLTLTVNLTYPLNSNPITPNPNREARGRSAMGKEVKRSLEFDFRLIGMFDGNEYFRVT